MGKEQMLIEQIHHEFDTAQNVILREAKMELEHAKSGDADYSDQLKKLGFTQAPAVHDARRRAQGFKNAAEMAKKVLYYKKTYPFLKFLTEEKLVEICERYNLIFAPVGNYTRNVPKKNLKEIAEAQKLKPTDAPGEAMWQVDFEKVKWSDDASEQEKDFVKNYRDYDVSPYTNTTGELTRRMTAEGFGVNFQTSSIEWNQRDLGGLFIAAPETHFDLAGTKKTGVLGFFKTKVEKDPIVFRYVKGGIQVLSKWGLEANDPELANDLDN